MNINHPRNQFRGYEVNKDGATRESPLRVIFCRGDSRVALKPYVPINSLKGIICLLILCFLTACNSETPEKTAVPPTLTATATTLATPDLPVEVRLALEPLYENLRQAYEQMSTTWEGLAAGEQSQCGIAYTGLAPEMISGEHDLYQTLRQAAIDLEQAAQLWQGECENPRPNVPQAVIDQGVLHVRAANDKLILIEQALAPQ